MRGIGSQEPNAGSMLRAFHAQMHELSQQMNVHRSVPRLPARETKANDSLEMCKRCVRRDQEEMSGEWPLQASECQGAMLVRDPLSAAGSEMYKGMFTILITVSRTRLFHRVLGLLGA